MDWHRLFGLLLTDFFTGSPFVVELEKDLSIKQQFLDVVILRKRKGRIKERLPDGFDNLTDYNLVTFKSFQETLDDWALKELTGHYVNYRKQLAEGEQPLLPESAFRLYAVCSRFPHNLAQEVPWESLQPGVYECRRGTDRFRVIVAGQLPRTENNALLHLFSASVEQWRYGSEHYRQRSADSSTLINELLKDYRKEGIDMPYTIEDFRREYAKEHFKDLTPEEQREAIQHLTPEELFAALSPEQIKQFRKLLNGDRPSNPSKKRRRK
jgi:hypothetical protein